MESILPELFGHFNNKAPLGMLLARVITYIILNTTRESIALYTYFSSIIITYSCVDPSVLFLNQSCMEK
jgi:hypothetical protein